MIDLRTVMVKPQSECGFYVRWRHHYPDHYPIGYLLRASGAKHWVRFHSLPLSKRYAENDAEKQILLSRHNALAEATGLDRSCWLAQSCWNDTQGRFESGSKYFWACHEYGLSFDFTFVENDGDDQRTWKVYVARTTWEQGAFDKLLLSIAGYEAAPTLWMNETSGTVFAPYDGGVDIFLPRSSMVDDLKARYADWLSIHPSGL